ncbi:MAG: hypothetical protein CV081_13045 [Nitrospira sp. LK265]|nr:hypothetical protein [Nitrospira sp. LK265]
MLKDLQPHSRAAQRLTMQHGRCLVSLPNWSLICGKACVLRRCGSVGEVAVLADRLHWFATCRRSALLTGQRLFHQLAAAETASSTVRAV